MKNVEIQRQIARLEFLIKKASATTDFELAGHWARYFCVLASGLLENAIPELYGAYSRTKAHARVSSYVTSRLKKVQNPKAERFIEISRSFDPIWADALETFLNDGVGQRKDAIDSIMNHRHLVAHGKMSSISIAQVKEYLKLGIEVLQFIEVQLTK